MPSVPAAPPPHIAFLTQRSTRALIAKYLGKRVAPHEVDELLQLTLICGVAAKDPPTAPKAFRSWVLRIAHDRFVDHERKLEHREEHGPFLMDPDTMCEDGQRESAPDYKDLVRNAGLDDGEVEALGWLRRHKIEGESFVSIARDAGVDADAVRYRTRRLMKRLMEAASAAALILLLFMFAGMDRLFLTRPRETDVARKDEVPTGPSASQPAEETPAQEAAALRAFAYQACDEGRWRDCNVSLNKADNLDPAGENDPREVAARQKLKDVMRELDRKEKMR